MLSDTADVNKEISYFCLQLNKFVYEQNTCCSSVNTTTLFLFCQLPYFIFFLPLFSTRFWLHYQYNTHTWPEICYSAFIRYLLYLKLFLHSSSVVCAFRFSITPTANIYKFIYEVHSLQDLKQNLFTAYTNKLTPLSNFSIMHKVTHITK